MATVTVWTYSYQRYIRPHGTDSIWIGPSGAITGCAVTVTAYALPGLGVGPQYMELIQTATRAGDTLSDIWLDLVVRNNSPNTVSYYMLVVSLIHA